MGKTKVVDGEEKEQQEEDDQVSGATETKVEVYD